MEIQVFKRPKSRIYTNTLLMLAFIAVATFSYIFYSIFSTNDKWTADRLENSFNVDFPDDVDLTVEGRPSLPVVNVQFSTSAEVVEQFVSQLCNGILHEGFDPFNAVQTIEPLPEMILFEDEFSYYYAYSPDTLATTRGNICVLDRGGVLLVATEPTNNNGLFSVELELHFMSGLPGYADSVIYKENWLPFEATD